MLLTDHPDFVTLNDLTVTRDHLELLHANNLTTLDQLMTTTLAKPINKPGLPKWRDRARLDLIDPHGQTHILFMKRYTNPPANEQRSRSRAGDSLHGSGWIEWQWMQRLADAGIPAVRPVAYGQKMEGRHEIASVVITAAVEGQSLESWSDSQSSPAPRDWITEVATLVARLHANNFFHRDLYLCHVFVEESAEIGNRFRLIDLQRMIEPRFFKTRWIVKDLAALNYSTPPPVANRPARIRFIREYLAISQLTPAAKSLIRKIEAKTEKIAHHDQRRNERLAGESGS